MSVSTARRALRRILLVATFCGIGYGFAQLPQALQLKLGKSSSRFFWQYLFGGASTQAKYGYCN